MKTVGLKDYFKRIGYSFNSDIKAMNEILLLTKTRDNLDLSPSDFEPDYGMEQAFLVRSVAEDLNASNFFEIGTGRGTACYSVSRIGSINNVLTVDIVPFKEKTRITISYSPAIASNEDIYNLISFSEKQKIKFRHVSDYEEIKLKYEGIFDLCFIDGCHEDEGTIWQDFEVCHYLVKNGGYIIWDDYDPNRFKVKNVVDKIQSEYGYECELIEFRGHLFGDKSAEKDAGEVLMKIDK